MPAVEICVASLDVDRAEACRLEQFLSADERAGAGRFHFQRDRDRFVVRRGLLREWLACRLNERPDTLAFESGEWGKPRLRDHSWHFSLSHSSDRLLVAISEVEVGCDIERIDSEFDWLPLAQQMFAPCALAELQLLAPDQGRYAFFRRWVRLEASLKAAGLGLGHDAPTPDAMTANLVDVDVGRGYAAAIATASDGQPLHLIWASVPEHQPV